MPYALKACVTPGCPAIVRSGKCPGCVAIAEERRGNRHERGYGRTHETRFRPGVLRRDPLCVCGTETHGHGVPCLAMSTVADHYPLSKRELQARGLDSNDPKHGRGLCEPCHNAETSVHQPGGWNAR